MGQSQRWQDGTSDHRHLDAVAAGGLGAIQRGIGAIDGLLGQFVAVELAHANADRHVQDFFAKPDLRRLHGLPQRVVLVANEAFTVLFCALFLWGGWVFMQRASKFSTPAIGMPNWLYYLPAFVGMLVFTLVALRRLARVFGGRPAAGKAP